MNETDWPEVVVFGTKSCGDCHVTRRFLESRGVPFRYHDVDVEGLSDLVIRLNEDAGVGSRRRVPTVVIDDTILSVPSNAELAERLGLR